MGSMPSAQTGSSRRLQAPEGEPEESLAPALVVLALPLLVRPLEVLDSAVVEVP